ncbi:hypothetical protein Tco_1177271, partial [Tanacetum coccineum]
GVLSNEKYSVMAKIHLSGSSPKNFGHPNASTGVVARHLPVESEEDLELLVTRYAMCPTEAEKPRLVAAPAFQPHLDDL